MKLEKNYRIPAEIYRLGYTAYQKKHEHPRMYIVSAIFLVIAADMIYAAIQAPENYLAYIIIAICLALAFREWITPMRKRRIFFDTVKELEETEYRITVTEDAVEFSTVSVVNVEKEDGEGSEVENQEIPEPTKLPVDKDLKILEYERFFLVVYGKMMFYIVPKEGFTEQEMAVLRNINK